ncbi:bacteriocin-like protein [Flavobacterium sp. HSC-32F16]|nr:bacteriocin [Flavobacterium sp. HSC-32F16]MCP2026542.1 bacteriocin-like protein [Flavobacterium sp. HSC-32F16]
MENLTELTQDELENIDGGLFDALSFGLAAL